MKNNMNLLIVLSFLFFACLACSDGPSMDADLEYHPLVPREFLVPSLPQAELEPNDTESYWDDESSEPAYISGNPADITPIEEKDLAEYLKFAKESEANYKKSFSEGDKYGYDVRDATIFYSRVAVQDETYLPKAVEMIGECLKYKIWITHIGQDVLELITKYPESAELKAILPELRKAYLLDLKENDFNPGKPYLTSESWQPVYGTGAFTPESFQVLGRIAQLNGRMQEYANWQKHLASFYLFPHTYDGVTSDSKPRTAYEIYVKLKETALAKKAALAAGDQYLSIYYRGDYRVTDGSISRHKYLPYDIEQAKVWYVKAELSVAAIDLRIEKIRKENAKTETEDLESFDNMRA